MKKLDFFKYAVIFAAFFVVFLVAGCGNDENDIDRNHNGGDDFDFEPGTGFDDPITLPTNPPTVSGGQLTQTGGIAVTQENLSDFINRFGSAIGYGGFYISNNSALRTQQRPSEYFKGIEKSNESYTNYGDHYGRAEITEDYIVKYSMENGSEMEIGYSSETYKFFDFSNSSYESLYLGGAVGILEIYDYKEINISNTTTKANGTINFAGKYSGKMVFENVTFERKYRYNRYDSTYNEQENYWDYNSDRDTLLYQITNGSYYIQSDDGQRINLPGYLISRIYSYSENRGGYPEGQINDNNKKMPDVPTAPNGELGNHAGNNRSVNKDNMNEFFKAFIREFRFNEAPASRAVNEFTEIGEALLHGRVSGYYSVKGNWISKQNNLGEYGSETGISKFNDYSNRGVLYLGGGFGQAVFRRKEDYEKCGKFTSQINGKIKFNGEFQGELDYQNFRIDASPQSGYTFSGKVMIGNLDVSGEYFEYAFKEMPIYDAGVSGELAGAYGEKNSFGDDNYREEIFIFESDGTGSEVDLYKEYVCYNAGGYNGVSGGGSNGGAETQRASISYFTYEFDEDTNTGVIYYSYGYERTFTFDGYDAVKFNYGDWLTRK